MAQWTAFAGVTIVVLVLLLVLTRLSERAVSPDERGVSAERDPDERDVPSDERDREPPDELERDPSDGSDAVPGPSPRSDAVESATSPAAEPAVADEIGRQHASPVGSTPAPADLSSTELLANVGLSQGLFAVVLAGAAIYADIPADAFGIEFGRAYVVSGVLVGAAVGVALYLANEVGAAGAAWLGFDHDERLRELLAPDSPRGWVVLLAGVLPLIALFEELLFRAALIGVLSTGFDLSPLALAVVSSIAFGLGHGIQGSVGVLVTAALGFVLALTFIYTGSFLVVVVAHYLINAFEFVVHEGIGLDWADVIESYN